MLKHKINLEPAAVVGVIQAIVAMIVTFGLSAEAAGVIMLVVIAAGDLWSAWKLKNTMLAALVGLIKAAAVFAAFFTTLDLNEDQVGALIAAVTVLSGLFVRSQTSPLDAGSFSTDQTSDVPVLTEVPPGDPA